MERRPFAHLAFRPNTAAMALDNALYDDQPNTVPFKLVIGMQALKHAKKFARHISCRSRRRYP